MKVDSFIWKERTALQKSKSDSSIIPIGDCNYRNQAIQVSLDEPISSLSLENLRITDNLDHNNSDLLASAKKGLTDYVYDNVDFLLDGMKTHEKPTMQLVMQKPDVLKFQGVEHTPQEIAPYWKKDCRTWLWKSSQVNATQSELSILTKNDKT